MSLELLRQNASLSIFCDNQNEWIYLDWCGDLTLRMVQQNCGLIARCFSSQNYSRILNDNTNVTSITSDVGHWLATHYLPYIEAAGVEYVAWVHASNIDAQACTDVALYDVLTPLVALFNDLATAYSWLRAVKFKAPVVMMPATKILYQHEMNSNVPAPRPHYI